MTFSKKMLEFNRNHPFNYLSFDVFKCVSSNDVYKYGCIVSYDESTIINVFRGIKKKKHESKKKKTKPNTRSRNV